MLNNRTGQGRLVKDIEIRYTPGNVAVTSFTIACDRDVRNSAGEREADFIDVVAWRGNAEFAAKFFKKGDMMIVKGRIQTRLYTDKEDNKRKSVEVVAENINFGGNKKQSVSEEPREETSAVGDDGFMEAPDEANPFG